MTKDTENGDGRQVGRYPWKKLAKWCNGYVFRNLDDWRYSGIWVLTPNGYRFARIGYWVIKDTNGEFYVNEPNPHAVPYEPVEVPE